MAGVQPMNAQQAKKVDASALRSASAEEWLTAGRDYSETHFRWLLG
jgi:hypothetical protein